MLCDLWANTNWGNMCSDYVDVYIYPHIALQIWKNPVGDWYIPVQAHIYYDRYIMQSFVHDEQICVVRKILFL